MVWHTDKQKDRQILTDTGRERDGSQQIFTAPEKNGLDPNGMQGCTFYRVRLSALHITTNLNVRQRLF
jgi:hypothetical protein